MFLCNGSGACWGAAGIEHGSRLPLSDLYLLEAADRLNPRERERASERARARARSKAPYALAAQVLSARISLVLQTITR
jgi:hypothetical protein